MMFKGTKKRNSFEITKAFAEIAQSGLDKDVPDGEIRFGSPALPGINYHRSFAVFKELPDMRRRLAALEKEIKK